MSTDLFIVGLIVLCAVFFFAKRVYISLRKGGDCGCGCGQQCCSKQQKH